MSNLAANTTVATADRGKKAYVVKNSETIYAGALVGTVAAGHLDHWADTAANSFEGILLAKAVGNTSASPPVNGEVDTSGRLMLSAAVAGATTIAANNAYVYCASDNPADMTLTRTTNVGAIGRVARWIESGICDVALFTPTEYLAHAGLAANTRGVYTLSVPWTFVTSTSAIDVFTAQVLGHAFRILAWEWHDGGTALVGSSGSRVANMEIGTTDVGTVASTVTIIQSGTATGRRIAGTAVSGANTGTATDTFSIEIASGGTDITAGNGVFTVTIQNLDAL